MAEKEKPDSVLDEAAMNLFKELEGFGSTTPGNISEDSTDDYFKENDWRILLTELVESISHQLCGFCITDASSGEEKKEGGTKTDQIIQKLEELSKFSNKNKKLLIRYRAMSQDGQNNPKNNYEISYGKLRVDPTILKDIAKERDFSSENLSARLNKAFEKLASMKIKTLQVRFDNQSDKNKNNLLKSFQSLPKFFAAGEDDSFFIVKNEKHRPDPNLTLLAVLNGLKKPTINGLIKKVDAMRKSRRNSVPFSHYFSIFDVIFFIKKLRRQLIKPPVEINNLYYLEFLSDCFDDKGRFVRKSFEKNISAFISAEKDVFGFIWDDFKKIKFDQDRIDFLNALKFMIAEMKYPHEALKFLIDDFSTHSGAIEISDRFALMLSNILLCDDNKTVKKDIETTPEEMLKADQGLNKKLTALAIEHIESESHEYFYQKIEQARKKLKKLLSESKDIKEGVSITFLIALLREAYIFLSLIGGPKSHKIIRDAFEEYRDPESEVYNLDGSKKNLKNLLSLLQVTGRGLSRFGEPQDLPILEMTIANSTLFKTLSENSDYRDQVERVMEQIDTGIWEIQENEEGDDFLDHGEVE